MTVSIELAENFKGAGMTPIRRRRVTTSAKTDERTCYRCGNTGHFSRDLKCPARGKTCRKCNGKDHFAKVCKIKQNWSQSYVNKIEGASPPSEYAFMVQSLNESGMIDFSVGGVDLNRDLKIYNATSSATSSTTQSEF